MPTRSPHRALRLIHVGTSGYVYPHWRERFYPADLPAREWLPYFARHFETVELNNTFYRLPTESAVRGWASAVPEGFVFAVKGSRYLTHIKRLKDTGEGIRRFFEPVRLLGDKCGPVLWQLPPQMKKDVARLAAFLEALPGGYGYVVEFRNPEWYADDVYQALADHDAALCLHDHVDVEAPFPPPGPFYYRRFHGAGAKYGGRYGREGLRKPAAEMTALARAGEPCWAYFNNDINAAAIHDARTMRQLIAEAAGAGPSAHQPRV